VSGALVTITDTILNKIDTLSERNEGVYTKALFVGKEGHTYKMTVKVEDEVFTAISTMPYGLHLDSLAQLNLAGSVFPGGPPAGTPAAGTTISGGWVETNWTQGAPYNNFCPVDPTNDNRSIAGCPSVAMGMIVDFHKTTNNVSFDDGDDYHHNYAGRNYWIDDDYLIRDFPSWPMLNTYLDTLEEHYISGASLTNNDKAALVFACGVAAKQVYTSSGSGTFSVSQAYDAYVKFNFNQAQLLDTSDISDSSFYKIIIQNIKDTLPVHLAIVDSLWNTGHNIVVDGYNTDGFFHFNFGWGGSSNGWYQMLYEMPYSMNFIEGAVVNIKPGSSIGIQKKFCNDILAYPNPTSDLITIELPENTSNFNSLFVYNSLGQEIIQTHLSTDNVNKIHLNLSQLCVGVYSIIIKTENNIFRFRIIKS
jgi:hypothetical protein